MNELDERNRDYLIRKQKELKLTDKQMLKWVKGYK